MIYTSYFARYKGDNGVAICLGAPWWKGERYPNLAPSSELLNWWKGSKKTIVEWNLFTYYYQVQTLSQLDVHKVAKELDGKVLLCFEKPSDYCHRIIVADWLQRNGYECEELI